MRRLVLLLPFLVSAAPPDDAVRRGVAALAAGDAVAADQLFAVAGETTTDPGLIAFDRGTAHVALGHFRDAELWFTRALDDADIPPARRARAEYNRGVCLLQRATEPSAARSAVGCFERAVEMDDPDPGFAADAKHNLELAKLLWAKARAKQPHAPTPNDPLPDERPPPRLTPPPGQEPDGSDGNANGPGANPPATAGGPKDNGQRTTDNGQRSAGSGPLPVLADTAAPQVLSPDDARAHLRRAVERADRERRATAKLAAGPERPGVADW